MYFRTDRSDDNIPETKKLWSTLVLEEQCSSSFLVVNKMIRVLFNFLRWSDRKNNNQVKQSNDFTFYKYSVFVLHNSERYNASLVFFIYYKHVSNDQIGKYYSHALTIDSTGRQEQLLFVYSTHAWTRKRVKGMSFQWDVYLCYQALMSRWYWWMNRIAKKNQKQLNVLYLSI